MVFERETGQDTGHDQFVEKRAETLAGREPAARRYPSLVFPIIEFDAALFVAQQSPRGYPR